MDRITNRHLDMMVEQINKATGSPTTPYTKDDSGRMCANIGNYHVSGAYGGVALHRMCTDGGGIDDVFRSGHMTKRELFNRMKAFLDGIEAAKEGHS